MHNLIAHALIQNDGGQILITRRTMIKRGKENYEGGRWDIPGGTVEEMEIPSEAAVREAKEEVALNVSINKVIYEKSNIDNRKNQVFTTLIYSCRAMSPDCQIDLDLEEHDAYKWMNPNDILKMKDEELVSYMKDVVMAMLDRK